MKVNDSASGAYKVNSLIIGTEVDPAAGRVTWDGPRSIWNWGMLLGALILGPLFITWDAALMFLIFFEITMCCGHSVGFHRRLIHRTFQCPKWVERILVYLGVLVGMHGPLMEWSGRALYTAQRGNAGRGYEGAPPCPTNQL